VNLGTVAPTILKTEEEYLFNLTRGKAVIIFLAIIYFIILTAVLMADVKHEKLLDNESSETIEFKGILDEELGDSFLKSHPQDSNSHIHVKPSKLHHIHQGRRASCSSKSIGPCDYLSLGELLDERSHMD
jgi:hypothetical protein